MRIPMLLLFKERYRRLEVDVKAEEEGIQPAGTKSSPYLQTYPGFQFVRDKR